MIEYGHFIGGKRVPGASGRTGEVFQPMDGTVRAHVAFADLPLDLERVLHVPGDRVNRRRSRVRLEHPRVARHLRETLHVDPYRGQRNRTSL